MDIFKFFINALFKMKLLKMIVKTIQIDQNILPKFLIKLIDKFKSTFIKLFYNSYKLNNFQDIILGP